MNDRSIHPMDSNQEFMDAYNMHMQYARYGSVSTRPRCHVIPNLGSFVSDLVCLGRVKLWNTATLYVISDCLVVGSHKLPFFPVVVVKTNFSIFFSLLK